MRIISQKKIKDFYGLPQYEQAKIPLQQWYYTIRNRDYRSFAQILVDFGDTVRENTNAVGVKPGGEIGIGDGTVRRT